MNIQCVWLVWCSSWNGYRYDDEVCGAYAHKEMAEKDARRWQRKYNKADVAFKVVECELCHDMPNEDNEA